MDAEALEVRMAHLEGAYEQVDRRLGAMEGEIRSLRGETQELGRKLDANFRWVIGMILVNWITLMLAILFRP
jgi:tetrahydromethanopterin S-methyltransferase subunit G